MSGSILSPDAFTKPLPAIRFVQTLGGDTIERLALRETGDARNWYDIVNLNGLRYPFLTDDPAKAVGGVVLTGSMLKVPIAAPDSSGVADPKSLFGTDISLSNGLLTANGNGDLATVAEEANLDQAIRHRLATHVRELVYHKDYGCKVYTLIGKGNNPAANLLANAFISQCILSDKRISSLDELVTEVIGDTIACSCVAVAVDGRRIPVRQVLSNPRGSFTGTATPILNPGGTGLPSGTGGTGGGGTVSTGPGYILLEDGSFFLTEDGARLETEQ